MKNYKVLLVIGYVVIALIVGMIIGTMLPDNTVDFNGRVTEIAENEDGTYTLKAESVVGGEFTFIIDGKSDLENCCDEEITIDKISVGGIVIINYRNSLLKKDEIKTIKDLTYFVDSENADGN